MDQEAPSMRLRLSQSNLMIMGSTTSWGSCPDTSQYQPLVLQGSTTTLACKAGLHHHHHEDFVRENFGKKVMDRILL